MAQGVGEETKPVVRTCKDCGQPFDDLSGRGGPPRTVCDICKKEKRRISDLHKGRRIRATPKGAADQREHSRRSNLKAERIGPFRPEAVLGCLKRGDYDFDGFKLSVKHGFGERPQLQTRRWRVTPDSIFGPVCTECGGVLLAFKPNGDGIGHTKLCGTCRAKKKPTMSLAERDRLEKELGGICPACGRPNSTGRKLSRHHCHETGANLGLLCHNCNATDGLMDSDPALLRRLADHIEGLRSDTTSAILVLT